MGLIKQKKFNPQELGMSSYYFTIGDKKYAFDVDKIKEICVKSSNDEDAEHEITTTYETDDNGNLEISGKLIREVKSENNAQNGMIVYDVIKLFIMRLMDNAEVFDANVVRLDFSSSLAINTLLNCGILIEIK